MLFFLKILSDLPFASVSIRKIFQCLVFGFFKCFRVRHIANYPFFPAFLILVGASSITGEISSGKFPTPPARPNFLRSWLSISLAILKCSFLPILLSSSFQDCSFFKNRFDSLFSSSKKRCYCRYSKCRKTFAHVISHGCCKRKFN